ncbi:MAG: sialidase family protein, partial [bacterium]
MSNQEIATTKQMNRRLWLKGFLSGAGACTSLLKGPLLGKEQSVDLINHIDRHVIWSGRNRGETWFHPRACLVPGERPFVLMTCQTITGSDVFSQVHWSVTYDNGWSWTSPEPVPSLGRQAISGLLEEGSCDVVPEFHPSSNSVLAVGHNVFYKKDVLTRPYLGRYTVYVVRQSDGEWSERRKLRWDNPMATGIYSAGCAQRITLGNGQIILPLSFGPLDRVHRSVCTMLCSFDGGTLKALKTGNELKLAVRRGLLEPS